MANTKSHSIGPGLSRAEQVAGFCYLPIFVALLGFGLNWLNLHLDLNMTELQVNICYFVINALFTWIIFHQFLLRSFRNIRFWELVQALILGFVMYYAGNFILGLAAMWLGLEIPAYNNDAVLALTQQNQTVMIVCGVILAPVAEETFVRGLIFGSIRKKSRILAYVVSVLFFAAVHVWQFAFDQELQSVLLAAAAYLPAGIALGWTYEKADTIWAPIGLHMAINAIAFGVMSLIS